MCKILKAFLVHNWGGSKIRQTTNCGRLPGKVKHESNCIETPAAKKRKMKRRYEKKEYRHKEGNFASNNLVICAANCKCSPESKAAVRAPSKLV